MKSTKGWKEIKSSIDDLPGGMKAVLTGTLIGLLTTLSVFFNVWVGVAAFVTIVTVMYLMYKGVIMNLEAATVVATAFVSVPVFLVAFFVVMAAILLLQHLILLIL